MLVIQNQDSVINTLMIICAAISLGGIINILVTDYIYYAMPRRRRRRQRESKQYQQLHLTENRVKHRINKE